MRESLARRLLSCPVKKRLAKSPNSNWRKRWPISSGSRAEPVPAIPCRSSTPRSRAPAISSPISGSTCCGIPRSAWSSATICKKMLKALVSGEMPLDIFVFEGTVVNAPNGTGEWNRFAGRPMKDWVEDLANGRHLHRRGRRLRDLGRHSGDRAEPVRERGPAIPEARAWRLPRQGLQVEGRPAGHQHSRLSGASRLDHADRGGGGDRDAAATSRSMSSSGRRPSSPASRRPAAPATCTSPTRSRRPSSASARAACSTTSAAAGR